MFEDQLFSMKDLMNSILQGQSMLDSWKEAYIVLMLKEGQDLTLTIYYSLLNDYKLFTSILAERLKNVLQVDVHEDQCDLLPKRQLKDNVIII